MTTQDVWINLIDGSKRWFLGDKRHRVDAPAIEWANGSKAWWIDGKPHRTNGPAFKWADGTNEWWIDGERTSTHVRDFTHDGDWTVVSVKVMW